MTDEVTDWLLQSDCGFAFELGQALGRAEFLRDSAHAVARRKEKENESLRRRVEALQLALEAAGKRAAEQDENGCTEPSLGMYGSCPKERPCKKHSCTEKECWC